jgi:hypothetical protein
MVLVVVEAGWILLARSFPRLERNWWSVTLGTVALSAVVILAVQLMSSGSLDQNKALALFVFGFLWVSIGVGLGLPLARFIVPQLRPGAFSSRSNRERF